MNPLLAFKKYVAEGKKMKIYILAKLCPEWPNFVAQGHYLVHFNFPYVDRNQIIIVNKFVRTLKKKIIILFDRETYRDNVLLTIRAKTLPCVEKQRARLYGLA